MIKMDGVAIAAARSCDIHVAAEVNEVSSASSGTWRERLVGRKDWSVTINKLLTDGVASVLTVAGTEFTLTVINRNDSTDQLSGQAILQEARVVGSVGALAQGSWRFIGNGALT